MRTGFVIAGSSQNHKPFLNQPLGVLYLQTILEKEFGNRIDSSIIDLRGISPENAIYHVPEKDVYFHSVTSPDYPDIQYITNEIRRRYPKARHVAGGVHVEIFPNQSLEVFDTISLGDGEESIKRIIEDQSKSNFKKIYRQENNLDINMYPYASRKYLPASVIAEKGKLNRRYEDLMGTDVLFSRGCQFSCHFCANLHPSSTRFRSPELIADEINYLKREYGIGALAIKDDQSIPVDRRFAKPTLEAIASTDIKWRGQSRANGVHPDMVKLAKESGCVELAVGIESVSQEALKNVNKRIDFKRAKEYLSLLKRENIDRKLLLIIGLPGEPRDIADQTISFIKETEPSNVSLSILCPVPGSELYAHPEQFGIIIKNEGFDKFRTTFGRFDEKEKPTLTFDYEDLTPFGRGMKSEEIIHNYMKVQSFLRDNGLNF